MDFLRIRLETFQRVLNSAARLLTGTHKYNHITPILIELHWLPVEQRIIYKPSRSLRSSKANLLNEPRFNVNSNGGRAFYVYSPRLWNKLPTTIRACVDFMEFKSKLKTHFV